MISSDLVKGIGWMDERGFLAKEWENWTVLLTDFEPYTAGAFHETLRLMFRSGRRFPPKPQEVLAELIKVQSQRVARGEDVIPRTCNGAHVWARPLPFDDDRHLTCVLCGEAGGLTTCDHVFNAGGFCVYCPVTKAAS